MTNDYKNNIIDFITGNLPNQEGIVQPQFENVQQTTNNLTSQIETYFTSVVSYVDFVPSKNNKNQDLEYSVIACYGDLIGESQTSGAFVILDKDYNIIDIITHYSDGSLIGVLYCLNVDDNGNYYAVELNGSTYRIVLLNNLVLKPVGSNTYKAIKIETYNLPNTYTWDSVLKVFKNDGGNKYFVVANRTNSNGMVGCELTIEDTKVWKFYTTSYSKQWTYAAFDNGYNVYWDSNSELHFQIAVNDYGLVILSKGSGTAMDTTRYTRTDNPNQHGNFIFYSNKIGYYAYVIDNDPTAEYYIFKVDLETKQAQQIYNNTGQYSSYCAIWLFKNVNSIYYYKLDLTDNVNKIYDLTFAMINEGLVYEVALGQFTATIFLDAFCYANVITDFNKNYVLIQNQNTLFSLDFIWNPNNYNGQPYISMSSLIPNTITIQDENNITTFNRNIYNLTNYANWYTASVQIPNYYLNNSNIYSAKLYSKNNNEMASKNINTTKNIYEEVNINFINKFNIIINNHYQTKTENVEAASLFVNAMLNGQLSARIGKYRINYEDETSEIKNTKFGNVYNHYYYYYFLVYTSKKINSIDVLSEDETIVYNTINCSNLELNKYYRINQNVAIR